MQTETKSKMKLELLDICYQLKQWTEKYQKSYVSLSVIKGSVLANVQVDDNDYEELNIAILKEK